MPFSKDREYRSMSAFEVTEVDGEEESYVVEGYATTFDEPYELEGCGGEREVILRSALDDADMSDVIFQLNHEGIVYARQSNGTMALMCDEHGLHTRADLRILDSGQELAKAIRSGLICKMSWGFRIADGGYEYDPITRTFTITKIEKVYDVSAVSIPANQGTEIHTRSAYLDGAIEAARKELAERTERARAELSLKASNLER